MVRKAPEFRVSNIVRQIPAAATGVATAKARLLKASGRDVIEMARGEPYFDTPEHIVLAARQALERGQTKYTAVDGTAELKEAVRDKFQRENGLTYQVEQISVGAGCKQVLYNAFAATLDPGDEVLIPSPCWDCYANMIRLTGGNPVLVPCPPVCGFKLTPRALREAIGPRTRWLILNSPVNPTGAVYSAEEIALLAGVLEDHPQVWLMADQIYEHFVYDGDFASPVAAAPALSERTMTVTSVSKTYAMTGFRVGYGAGPAALVKAMARVQSNSTSNPCSVSQAAAAAALNGPQDIVAERTLELRQARECAIEALNSAEGLSCMRPPGAIFAFTSCRECLGRRTPEGNILQTDADFADALLEREGVAVTAGSVFDLEGYFRLTFGVPFPQLREATRRIARFCSSLS
jgi:aspartate aminotransferase